MVIIFIQKKEILNFKSIKVNVQQQNAEAGYVWTCAVSGPLQEQQQQKKNRLLGAKQLNIYLCSVCR